MVDIAGVEGRDPLEDYRQINDELVAFNPRLAGLRQIVALNKVDLLQSREPIEEFKKGVGDVEVLEISAATTQGTKALVLRLAELVKILPRTRLFAPEDLYQEIELAPVQGIVISREGDVFYLSGRRVDILAAKTDFNNDESLANFYRVAKKMGVFELLKSEGIKPGDTVVIADREFSYE
jgi:GTP-binding protein